MTERALKANAKKSKASIEKELQRVLDAKEIVWMPELPDEGTGHIDMYAKFLGENRVLVSDSDRPNAKRMLDKAAQTFKKLGLEVIRIKTGETKGLENSHTTTYTNALLVNRIAFIPRYFEGGRAEFAWQRVEKARDEAPKKLYRCLGYRVIQMPMSALLDLGGAVHCLTKHIPLQALPSQAQEASAKSARTDTNATIRP